MVKMAIGLSRAALLLLSVATALFPSACSEIRESSVIYNEQQGRFIIYNKIVDGAVAVASYSDRRTDEGWTFLEVKTNGNFPDSIQAYAAGLVEGFITADVIAQHWNNTVDGYCTPDASSAYCQRLGNFVDQSFNKFLADNIDQMAKIDPYWHQIELFLYQLNGMEDAYMGKPKKPSIKVNPFGLLMFQISGDLEDLEVALNKPVEERKKLLGQGSCSALIKLLPNNEDLYVSQDTWSSYQSMLRILKKYDFSYHMLENNKTSVIPGHTMTFSSYPGNLYSGDDFYILSSGLVSLETTIGNSNPNLNPLIQPTSVLEGIRNQVANRLATSGSSWADIFSRYNSGTYNNQWMIVDYNQFTPGKDLQKHTLTVLEQIPGLVIFDDMTPLLMKQGYWPSYNSPYFPQIFNASGCQANVDKYGDWFTYEKTPRAKIFRRDQSKVVDIPSMIKLMRYNNYQKDELSRCNCTPPYSAENAISARSDLNPNNGTYPFEALGHRSHGGTDMKMTNYELYKTLDFVAVSGPTHDDQPPFVWSKADFAADCPHEGHPDIWNFEPIQTHFDGI